MVMQLSCDLLSDTTTVDSAYASPGTSVPALGRHSPSNISQPSSGLSDSETLTDVRLCVCLCTCMCVNMGQQFC